MTSKHMFDPIRALCDSYDLLRTVLLDPKQIKKLGSPFVLTWRFHAGMSHSNMFSSAAQIILITRKLEALYFSCGHDHIPSGLHHFLLFVGII